LFEQPGKFLKKLARWNIGRSGTSARKSFAARKGKEGLICLLTEKINEELLGVAPKLRIAATGGRILTNIDVGGRARSGAWWRQHAGRAG